MLALKKVLIGFDEDLLEEIESYAKRMHISRTAAVVILCSKALESMNAITTMEKLLKAYGDNPERLQAAVETVEGVGKG